MANFRLIDENGLAKKLRAMSDIDFEKIYNDNLVAIFNRTRSMTPISTEKTRPKGPHGELRMSAGVDLKGSDGVVGYTKDYAPHVEYGHRTRNGGYVKGQMFLQKNVEMQRRIFYEDIRKAVENAK